MGIVDQSHGQSCQRGYAYSRGLQQCYSAPLAFLQPDFHTGLTVSVVFTHDYMFDAYCIGSCVQMTLFCTAVTVILYNLYTISCACSGCIEMGRRSGAGNTGSSGFGDKGERWV